MAMTFATTATPALVIREADRLGAVITLTETDVPAGYLAVFRALNDDTAATLVRALANAGARVVGHRAPRTLTSDETARRVVRDPFTFR
jgi:hypothetical protein